MARRRRTNGIESRLNDIVTQHVNGLVEAITLEIRRNVADEVSAFFSTQGGAGGFRLKKRRILQCIAPGCPNMSKGPRFHYLCDKHKDAPKKDYEAWRKAKKDKAA
jgi:hypothetical protein